jgi:peptidoglycan LD-endopeptidase CwlK
MSRKLDDLTAEMQRFAILFCEAMATAGIKFIFTCTYRTQEEQDRLYAQGRTTVGKRVTWNKHSKHTDREAFDVVPVDNNGECIWDDNELWERIGAIGESVGLRWGGRWIKRDRPHFEMKEEAQC